MWLALVMSCGTRVRAPAMVWPLERHRGHVIASMAVRTPRGPEKRRCLVDTGASFSVSDHPDDRLVVDGETHLLEHEPEIIEAFNVAGFNPKVTCVLGQDLLAQHAVARIDYGAMELRFMEHPTALTTAFPLLAHEPIVMVDVAGKLQAMLLDTGATTSALTPSVFDETGIPPNSDVEATTQHLRQRVLEAPIPIRWAGVTRRRAVRQEVASLRRLEARAGRPVVGLVGADLLGEFRVLEFRWAIREVAVQR